MKEFLKGILYFLSFICVMLLILGMSFSYVTNYKKTVVGTSISEDGKYELTLQAIGEPDWPFGSASGQLILKEGKAKVSKTKFELRNDGGSINSDCWEVTWHEDFVEIILSGKEQSDEQVVLYFDGTREIHH